MNKFMVTGIFFIGAAGLGYVLYEKKGMFNSSKSEVMSINNSSELPSLVGTPLVVMEGKTIITVPSFQEEKEKIFKMNPEWEQYKAFMDLDETIVLAMSNHAMMEKELEQTGVKNSQEYRDDLESGYKEVERMINTKYFTQKFSVNVTDTETKNFYEENKDSLPDAVVSYGGVKAMELVFDQASEANMFAEKVKADNGNIIDVAQKEGIAENKIKDLKMVHKQSMSIDNLVKDAILGMKTFPSVLVVKNSDNKYAVIVGTGKEEARYRPYDQIKSHIKAYLQKQKQAEEIEKALEALKKKYSVVIDLTPLRGQSLQENDASDLGDLNDIAQDDGVADTIA